SWLAWRPVVRHGTLIVPCSRLLHPIFSSAQLASPSAGAWHLPADGVILRAWLPGYGSPALSMCCFLMSASSSGSAGRFSRRSLWASEGTLLYLQARRVNVGSFSPTQQSSVRQAQLRYFRRADANRTRAAFVVRRRRARSA